MRGYVKPENEPVRQNDEQVLSMESERYCVPEVLFRPTDIGLNMAGVAEATWQSLSQLSQVISTIVIADCFHFTYFRSRWNYVQQILS